MSKRILFPVLAFLVAANFLPSRLPQAQPPATVRVGVLGSQCDGPFYVALEKGYFRERGIEPKLEEFASSVKMMAPLAGGEVQVGGGGVAASLYNAIARGLPIRAVATRSAVVPEFEATPVVIRPDLKDKIVKVADLKGRKIAVSGLGADTHLAMVKILATAGLSPKDAEMVALPPPDMGTALANKAIDAAIVFEPFPTHFQERGWGIIWKRSSEIIGPRQGAVLFYNIDWARKNPKLASDFMVAYIKASRDYYTAATRGPNREEVIGWLIKHTRVKDRAVYDKVPWCFIDPNGKILKESVKEQQEGFIQLGAVTKRVEIDQVVDETYLQYALKELGTVPCKECPSG